MASKIDLQTEMLKHIVKKTESSHENEIKKIYEEQRKELMKQISEQQKELSEKDSLIDRQNRDIMDKERLIMDLQKQLQAEKKTVLQRKGNYYFYGNIDKIRKRKIERVGCIHFTCSKLLR